MSSEKYRDADEMELEAQLKNYDLRGLELVYGEAKETLSMQIESIQSLDTKSSILLGFDGLIIVSLLAAWKDFFEGACLSVVVFITIATIALGISALLCLIAYRSAKYRILSPRRLFQKYVTWNPSNVKYVLVPMITKAIDGNHQTIIGKFKQTRSSFILTLVGITAYVVAFILNIFA